jgi:hypothetical protein
VRRQVPWPSSLPSARHGPPAGLLVQPPPSLGNHAGGLLLLPERSPGIDHHRVGTHLRPRSLREAIPEPCPRQVFEASGRCFEPRPECGCGQGVAISLRGHDSSVLDGQPMAGQIARRMRVDGRDCHDQEHPLAVVTGAASGARPARVRALRDVENLPEVIPGCPAPCRGPY